MIELLAQGLLPVVCGVAGGAMIWFGIIRPNLYSSAVPSAVPSADAPELMPEPRRHVQTRPVTRAYRLPKEVSDKDAAQWVDTRREYLAFILASRPDGTDDPRHPFKWSYAMHDGVLTYTAGVGSDANAIASELCFAISDGRTGYDPMRFWRQAPKIRPLIPAVAVDNRESCQVTEIFQLPDDVSDAEAVMWIEGYRKVNTDRLHETDPAQSAMWTFNVRAGVVTCTTQSGGRRTATEVHVMIAVSQGRRERERERERNAQQAQIEETR